MTHPAEAMLGYGSINVMEKCPREDLVVVVLPTYAKDSFELNEQNSDNSSFQTEVNKYIRLNLITYISK